MINLHDVTETWKIPGVAGGALVRLVRRASTTGGPLGLVLFVGSACSPQTPPEAPDEAAPLASEPVRAPWPEEPKPESIVHAEFRTSARAVKPKGTFLLAVRFDISDGYRISWQNPGDVGKSTRVSFEVPEGFSVGPLQYPAPRRFALPGKLVSYGYEEQTAIFAEVTAPERVPDGRTYRFDVKANWLACKDECATEELSAWFELASSAQAPEPELPSDIAVYHSAVPTAFVDLPESNLAWHGGAARPALTLAAAEVKWVDFFPADGEQPKLIAVKPAGDELRLEFARASASGPLRGLAVAEVAGGTAFYDVNVPWPSQ